MPERVNYNSDCESLLFENLAHLTGTDHARYGNEYANNMNEIAG